MNNLEYYLDIGNHFINNNCTVRSCARDYGVSKSALYNYLQKIKFYDKGLYKNIRKQLDINLKECTIRGGESTKKKYLMKRQG